MMVPSAYMTVSVSPRSVGVYLSDRIASRLGRFQIVDFASISL